MIKDAFSHVSIILFKSHYSKSHLSVAPDAVSYYTIGSTINMLQYAVLHGVYMVPSVVLYTSDVFSQSVTIF